MRPLKRVERALRTFRTEFEIEPTTIFVSKEWGKLRGMKIDGIMVMELRDLAVPWRARVVAAGTGHSVEVF